MAAPDSNPTPRLLPAAPEHLALILSSVADGITVQDRSGRLIYANDAAAQIIGYPTAAELLAAPLDAVVGRFEMLDEAGRPFSVTDLPGRHVLQGAPEAEATLAYRIRATGEEHWAIVRARPIYDRDGQVTEVVNIFHDITARKRAELDLRAAQQRAAFLAEASDLLAGSLDYPTTLTSVAHLAVPRVADWCAVDLLREDGQVERLVTAHVVPAKRELGLEMHRRYPADPDGPGGTPQVLRTGQPLFYPAITDAMLVATARDPEHLALMRAIGFSALILVPLVARGRTFGVLTLVSAESGRRYTPDDLALAADLARRGAVAIDNARLFQDAQAAIAIRDEFLSVASHELKTPLTSLLTAVQLVQRRMTREGTLDERDARALRLVVDQAARLNRMILTLLDLSRIEAGQLTIAPEPLDLGALVRRVVEEIQPTLDRHALELRAEDSPLPIAGDPLRLEQVVQNLVGNAVKYSPHGGSVTVTLERQGDAACLRVSDTGIGIPAEALSRLFVRFYRAPNAGVGIAGQGIGLYVVKEVVTLHGGTVDVQSVEGQGSTFTVCLPLLPAANTGPGTDG